MGPRSAATARHRPCICICPRPRIFRRRQRNLWVDTPLAKLFTAQAEWHLLRARAQLVLVRQAIRLRIASHQIDPASAFLKVDVANKGAVTCEVCAVWRRGRGRALCGMTVARAPVPPGRVLGVGMAARAHGRLLECNRRMGAAIGWKFPAVRVANGAPGGIFWACSLGSPADGPHQREWGTPSCLWCVRALSVGPHSAPAPSAPTSLP